MPLLVLVLVFCGAFCLVFGLWVAIRGSAESHGSRVLRRLSHDGHQAGQAAPVPILRRESKGRDHRTKHGLQRLPFTDRVRSMLEQAGMSVQAGTFVLTILLLAAFGLLVGWIVTGHALRAAIFALLLGSLPYVVVRLKRSKRIRQFTVQFPDALELMSSSMRAGHAFTASLGLVADEMPDPIAGEFRRVFEEQNYGMRMEDALSGLTRRIDSLDLKFFTMAVLIQRETGGNMAEILDKIGTTIRERFRILGQVRTLTAQGRLSGWVLGFLPLGIGTALYLMNPDYIMTLFTKPAGKNLLLAAGALQVCGFLLIRKIISIKV